MPLENVILKVRAVHGDSLKHNKRIFVCFKSCLLDLESVFENLFCNNRMANCSFISRIFPIPFTGLRKGICLIEHVRLTSSISKQNLYQISIGLLHQRTVLPNHYSCLSLRALKHTSKFSRGRGEKVVEEDEEDENASTDISV
jgi:hypothetical protein